MTFLVQQYFSQSAKRFPHKVAVSCADMSLSFEELERFSNAFARHLMELGVKRGAFVPFFMRKTSRSIQALLSILKADCAYVPLDFSSPGSRLLSILRTTDAAVVIVDDESEPILRAHLSAADSSVRLVNIASFAPANVEPLVYRNLSIDLAYVLFTSGSTGTPKGVMIPHKAIIDYIDWCVEAYALTDRDVISNHAPLYFDNSTFDLYTAFKTGATLQLVPAELNSVLPRLVSWLRDKEITTFFCVPSVLTMLLKSRRLKPDSFPKLRHLIFAGEVVQPSVLAQWMQLYPKVQFTNMYGPTEITVDCSFHVVRNAPEGTSSVPIGKARPNMELFVETEAGTLSQARGAEGQLLVRGTSVAYGYLGDAERTRNAFVQNPGHNTYFDPLYRTGDLVRVNDDGDYLFLGRADDQIKFLGHRIELGEIEAALMSLSGVSEAVVVFNNSPIQDEQQIGAMVCTVSEITAATLLAQLRERLPAYMVPTRLVVTSEEPARTPNGKYDRKAVLNRVFEPSKK